MANFPVNATAFAVFDMQALCADSFDAGLAAAADELAAVFFRGSDCFNRQVAKKAMPAQPEALRAPGLRWFHGNVYEHGDLGRRFMLHGVPTWFFFHCGKRLGEATARHGLGQFEAAVPAARGRVRVSDSGASTGREASGSRESSKRSGKSSTD